MKFLLVTLFTPAEGVSTDQLINVDAIITIMPNDEDSTSITLKDTGEVLVCGNFWTFHTALCSANPIVDVQPIVEEVDPVTMEPLE